MHNCAVSNRVAAQAIAMHFNFTIQLLELATKEYSLGSSLHKTSGAHESIGYKAASKEKGRCKE
jgi:hypothetical protein